MSPTSRLALNGPALVEFFVKHEQMRLEGHPKRCRRYINEFAVDPNTDGRILRRWSAGATVTRAGAERLLSKFDLTLAGFSSWCECNGQDATVRGEL